MQPGIDGRTFELILDEESLSFPIPKKFLIGKDIEIIGEPKFSKSGVTYKFKAISERAIKYLKRKFKNVN